MFQRSFPNVSSVLWNKMITLATSSDSELGAFLNSAFLMPAVIPVFSATVFMFFRFGRFTLFEKPCQVSQKRQHPSFHSSCLELNPWVRKVTSIYNKYSVLQTSLLWTSYRIPRGQTLKLSKYKQNACFLTETSSAKIPLRLLIYRWL